MIRAPWPSGYNAAKPHQWSSNDLNLLAGWCAAMVEDLSAGQPDLFKRLVDWTPGVTSSNGERTSGGEHGSSPVVRYVINTRGEDPLVREARVLVNGWSQVGAILEQMWTAARALSVADREQVAELMTEKPRAGSGTCANPVCGRHCTGTNNDRLRAGRCEDCYRYRKAHGIERDHGLCHRVQVGGCHWCAGE